LAQAYNNEELTAASGLSTDDTMLLELFKSRVKSGMVDAQPEAEKATPEIAPDAPRKNTVKRVRLTKN
jgi:hypothetical protein